MTEKRFAFVIDNGKDTFYDLSENGEIMNMIDTEEMLNELNDENIELHIQNDFLKEENQHMRDLVNENEQLKSENEQLRNELKQILNDNEFEWLRNNTVWEQMPSSKRTVTKSTSIEKQ